MFAYCGNNPINKIDVSGTKAYDLFDSPDEAALDFATCYNAQSIADKQEYGSAIFRYSYVETKTVTNTITIRIFRKTIKIKYYTTYDVLVTKYYYNKPAVGRSGHTVTPNFIGTGTIVSTVHTHANYDPKYDNENFSDDGLFSDIGWSNLFRMNSYMVTPGGYLKKYTYKNRKDANGGVTVIPGNIPWDPNCPYR